MTDQPAAAPLTDQQVWILLEEYRANIDLWIYEATFRQERSQMFLALNTVLLVALGAFTQFQSSVAPIAIVAIPISAFGFWTCLVWRRILVRNGAYMKFRRYQLRDLEAKLEGITTFTNQWKALAIDGKLDLPHLTDTFELKKAEAKSAISMENGLPLIVLGFWAFCFVASPIVLVLDRINWI